MKNMFFTGLMLLISMVAICKSPDVSIRLLVVTGGHDYNHETFNAMFASLSKNVSFEVVEFPKAFDMFLPENRNKYDILVFYHMWQTVTEDQKKILADCIAQGKPLVVLHHSICAFDSWDEYTNIVGGKYFHQPSEVNGKLYEASSYQHDININVRIVDKKHPVTNGISDFVIFDESYKNYYVSPKVKSLLLTDELTSTPVIGWCHKYGNSRVVTIQSGHDSPTFQNASYQKLLLQAIYWVSEPTK